VHRVQRDTREQIVVRAIQTMHGTGLRVFRHVRRDTQGWRVIRALQTMCGTEATRVLRVSEAHRRLAVQHLGLRLEHARAPPDGLGQHVIHVHRDTQEQIVIGVMQTMCGTGQRVSHVSTAWRQVLPFRVVLDRVHAPTQRRRIPVHVVKRALQTMCGMEATPVFHVSTVVQLHQLQHLVVLNRVRAYH